MARVLRVEGVSVAGADGVVVLAPVLAVVGAVLLAPRLGVERAVSPIGHVVDGEEVGVVEVACVVAAIRAGVAAVVAGVGSASRSAFAGIIDTREVFHAHVGVFAGSIEGSIDGTAELCGTIKARLRPGWVVLGVAVGAGDDDVELVAVLAFVDGGFWSDARAPESALDVCEAGRVDAVVTWVQGWVTFKVDVERCAEIGGIAKLLALNGVICLQRGETHIAVGIDRCLEIDKGSLVSLRGGGV